MLTGGIGLLPCPLTISVLGFAWVQGTAIMVMVVLAGLALGIATTIGIVAVVTILARHTLRQALAQRLPQLERGARVLQGAAGVAIIVIGTLTLSQLGLLRSGCLVVRRVGQRLRPANRRRAIRAGRPPDGGR